MILIEFVVKKNMSKFTLRYVTISYAIFANSRGNMNAIKLKKTHAQFV